MAFVNAMREQNAITIADREWLAANRWHGWKDKENESESS